MIACLHAHRRACKSSSADTRTPPPGTSTTWPGSARWRRPSPHGAPHSTSVLAARPGAPTPWVAHSFSGLASRRCPRAPGKPPPPLRQGSVQQRTESRPTEARRDFDTEGLIRELQRHVLTNRIKVEEVCWALSFIDCISSAK